MKDPLAKIVRDFLSRYFMRGKPILLGFSGGPDSKALLHLLLECRSPRLPLELHLAHVDHGWRSESKNEAHILAKEALELQLPFHLLTLEMPMFRAGNLEEQARNFRIHFFKEIYVKQDCQALLLAHQADDHAEVVLKRVCEGAHFSKLSGLFDRTHLEGMQVWRPLLTVRKKKLIAWLDRRKLDFFSDPTNMNPQFLRGRMRVELLPFLADRFGKEIIDNFCFLGTTAEALRSYFLKKISCHLDAVVTESHGSYLKIPRCLEELELQFLLKEWFAKENVFISRQMLHVILRKVLSKGVARFPIQNGCIYIDEINVLISKHKK